MLSFDLWNFIFMIINILILFFIAKKFLFGRVDSIIEKRKAEIAKSYDEADKALEKAVSDKKEYEDKLVKLENEKAEAVNKAAERINSEREGILEKADQEAKDIISAAREEAERITNAANLKHDKEVEEVVFNVASRLAGQAVSDEAGSRLYDQFLKEAEGQIGNNQ